MSTDVFSSGQLARAAAVGVQTVRYYERIGILPIPARSRGGHRQYGFDDIRRLKFIRRAQELGFTLGEIGEMLELSVEPNQSCESVAVKADTVLARIDRRVGELRAMQRALEKLRSDCDTRTPTGDCPILDALVDTVVLEENDP